MAPRARQAKGKARITAYEQLVAEAEVGRGRARTSCRSRSRPGRASATSSSRPTSSRKGYGDRLLVDDLSFSLPRGGIVGVIGPNGAGKTTLFRMLVGQEQPDDGALKIGPTVEFAYVDQSRESLDGDQDRLRGDHRRCRPPEGRRPRGPRPRVRRRLQLQGLRSAEERRRPVGWGAQPAAPRQGAADGRQRAAARRADERPRRRHAARARRGAARSSRAARW